MRKLLIWTATCLWLAAAPSAAQDDDWSGTYLVTSQSGQRAAPPVVVLQRRADDMVMMISFTSDTRDALDRTQEVHAMLLDALTKGSAAGLSLSTGNPVLVPLTRDNYRNIAMGWAGREDTSKADVFVSVPLAGTPAEAEKRIDAFVQSLTRQGRGTIYKSGGRSLAVRNPGQYRAQIVELIAADVRDNAAIFGPDYRAVIDGIDRPVLWSQVDETDVFLYLPYTYRIVAK
jgi:hypothetical protein